MTPIPPSPIRSSTWKCASCLPERSSWAARSGDGGGTLLGSTLGAWAIFLRRSAKAGSSSAGPSWSTGGGGLPPGLFIAKAESVSPQRSALLKQPLLLGELPQVVLHPFEPLAERGGLAGDGGG